MGGNEVLASAKKQREEYMDIHDLLLDAIRIYHRGNQDVDVLSDGLTAFLSIRGVSLESNLEDLVKQDVGSTAVLAEAFHFVRKVALKNYEFRDPSILIGDTSKSLEPANNSYAASFLSRLCSLMTEDKREQPNITLAINLLPGLYAEYGQMIDSLSTGANEAKREKLKERVLEFYTKILDGLLDFTKTLIQNKNLYIDFDDYRRKHNLTYMASAVAR